MKIDSNFNSKVGLSHETKLRLSLILQGTGKGPGFNITQLNFSKEPETRENEINMFIINVNKHFEGILQVVRSENYIVPIIINSDAIDIKRRALSSKFIALACIILLHRFYNEHGPTFDNLEKKLQMTTIKPSEIKSIIRELSAQHWIMEYQEENITYFEPTELMSACISEEMLIKIFYEVYNKETNIDLLTQFLPKEYIRARSKLQIPIKKINDDSNLNKDQ